MNDDKKNNQNDEEQVDNFDEEFDSFEEAADDDIDQAFEEELSEFEDWQGEDEENADDILEEEYAPEDVSTGSIEDDFSDFESQVMSDQAKIDKKRKSGGIIKAAISLLLLGGVGAGGAYAYFNYKDEIMALINPPQLQQTQGAQQQADLPTLGDPSNIPAMPGEQMANNNQTESRSNMSAPGLDDNTDIESFLPQPTPISETDVVSEPDMLDQPMDEEGNAPTLSQVIDNSQETLYDPQEALDDATRAAQEAAEQINNEVEDMGQEVIRQANNMADAVAVEPLASREPSDIGKELGNDAIPQPNMNQAEEKAGDFTDELYDPNEYEQSNDIAAATNTQQAAAQSNNNAETMPAPAPVKNTVEQTTQKPTMEVDDSDGLVPEVEIVNPSDASRQQAQAQQEQQRQRQEAQRRAEAQAEAKAREEAQAKARAEAQKQAEAAQVKELEAKAPQAQTTAQSQSKEVEIPSSKPKVDPYRAERNTTVYNLIRNQDLQMARRALSEKRYEDALKIFDRLYQDNSDNYDIAIGRALSLQYMGYNEQALSAYNEILASNPNDPIANNNKEMIMSMSPDQRSRQPVQRRTQQAPSRSQAAPSSSSVQQTQPGIPTSGNDIQLARQAVSLAQAGNQTRAIELIEKAIRLAPNNPMHVYNAAIIYDQAGQTSKAINLYERALELDSISGMENGLPRGLIYDRLAVIR